MTEEDMVELHVKISSKELAEFKKELRIGIWNYNPRYF